jgi:hypothetical protein
VNNNQADIAETMVDDLGEATAELREAVEVWRDTTGDDDDAADDAADTVIEALNEIAIIGARARKLAEAIDP